MGSSAPSIMDASNNSMHTESVNYRVTTAPQTKTTITPSAEIIPKSVGSSRAATEMTNFKNTASKIETKIQTNAATTTTSTIFRSAQQQVLPIKKKGNTKSIYTP